MWKDVSTFSVATDLLVSRHDHVPDPVVCDAAAGPLADGGRLLQDGAGRGQRVDKYLAPVAEITGHQQLYNTV